MEQNGKPAPIGQVIENIPINLDRPRSLRFTHHALMMCEKELNRFREIPGDQWVSIEVIILQAIRSDSLPTDALGFLLWSALLHEDPTLRPETVEPWIVNRKYCAQKIFEAIAAAWPRPKDEENDKVAGEVDKDRPLAPTAG